MKAIPAWALNHLKENLPHDATLLNVALHRRGTIVANTRMGAVVVTKTFFGEPRLTFLGNPRERLRLDCVVCAERLEFRRLDLPAIVHCALCGTTYAIDAAGHATVRERATWNVPVKQPVVFKAAAVAEGPFTYQGYTLYSRDVVLKNGGKRVIYFFAKQEPKSGTPSRKPEGFHVGVNERTGLPFLKRGARPDGEDLTPTVEAAYRPQCSALTEEGHQCRNSARAGSKYCASHFGYQPPAIAKAAAAREDTLPRVPDAPDTLPTVRRKSRKA